MSGFIRSCKWFLALLLLATSCWAQTERQMTKDCKGVDKGSVPRYRIAKRTETDLKPGYGLLLHISIKKSDFANEDILALGCKLRSDFKQFQLVRVFIFENHKNAKHYDPIGDINSSTMRLPTKPWMTYLYSQKTEDHYIEWYPAGTPYNTQDAASEKIRRIDIALAPLKS